MRDVAVGLGAHAADEPVVIAGALGLPPGRYGRVVSRLSERSLAQILDPSLRLVATSPSGARLEFTTDAEEIELELHLTRLQLLDRPAVPLVLDVVIDDEAPRGVECPEGAVIHFRGPADLELVDHPPVTIRLDDLGSGTKDLEIWLPHSGFAELVAVRVPDHASVVRRERQRPRWVHYGSSISHCLEAERPTETWPAAVARRHDLDLLNLGLAGQCHLDQLVARDIRDAAPDLVSLKLGVNVVNADSFRERTFVPALHGFLDTLRDGLPETPVLVVTSIICPPAEDRPGPTVANPEGRFVAVPRPEELAVGALSISRIRELVTQVVTARIAAGDEHLQLLDGLSLFGPDDTADLYDDLHPTPAGYLRMADRFGDLVLAPGGLWSGLVGGGIPGYQGTPDVPRENFT